MCDVVTPRRPNQDLQVPLQCFSWKLGSCRGLHSWRLSEQTQSPYLDWGNMWGRHTKKTMLRKTKPPCTKLTMLNFYIKKGRMKLCYLGNVVVQLVQLCHYKTANLLNLNLFLQPNNALGPANLNATRQYYCLEIPSFFIALFLYG